jgi:hypothetical protein
MEKIFLVIISREILYSNHNIKFSEVMNLIINFCQKLLEL